MVLITHNGDNELKINQIISTAHRHFCTYGLEKTTMREIAFDLGISKSSLYYYFPDKEKLFLEVVSREQDRFIEILNQTNNINIPPDQKLRNFVKLRNEHFKSFINISKIRFEIVKTFRPLLSDLYRQLNNREVEQIDSILKEGVEKSIFVVEDINKSSKFFLEMLQAIRSLVIKMKDVSYLDENDFEIIDEKTNYFMNFFIKGISIIKP